MKKAFFTISIIMNVVLIICLALIYKDKIKNKLINNYSIVFLGDSLTANGNWEDLTGINNTKKSGFPGFTSSHLVWLLHENVIKYDPDTCYLMAGVNDIAVGISQKRTQENFSNIIDSLISHDIFPVIQSTIYTADENNNILIDSLNQYLSILAKSKGIKFLNVNSVISKNKKIISGYSTDGVHLNEKGYKKWSDYLSSHK